ncbi:YczE/YyaS/YitT family protein [Sediminibacillus massiliensis]|uniref:YczE/YyaS/YitT family protein n=1 Tax=Sediminibacillus massiliensis TaxID=1926277 RepID=UPI0009885086|nr:membrane protein [Sediminibacillus massiliensis]
MNKQIKVRILFFLAGLIVLSFGISLTITADLGIGAWDAVNVALSSLTGLTVGNWVIIIGLLLIAINALIARERPDYLALVTIFTIGLMIDFWLIMIMDGWTSDIFWVKAAMLIGGILIIGFGVSMYLQPKLSLNPVDGLMVALQKRWSFTIATAKTLTECLALLLALLLGGPIGIGTIMILLFIGPSIQFFEPKAQRLMNSFM